MKRTIILGMCILIILTGCNNPQEDWRDKQIDDLYLEINKHILDNYNWICVEWVNQTEVNPEWIESCCVDLDMDLTDKNREQQIQGKVGQDNVTYSFRKEGNNTAYFGSKICFDVNETKEWDFSQIQIGNNQVNLSRCESIPQMIKTNESVCVLHRRRGW